ncbi:MAG: hypothetical protein Q7R32_09960 [Dehalococcoidia bacterium]|nr:hypothetical protein [Dehalococcoidia bacterium]
MTQPIVLKSLEELGRFVDLVVPTDRASNERALVPVVVEPIEAPDLDALAEAASRAAQELRQLAAADARARQEAEETLARYRRLQGNAARLERVAGETQAVAERASGLAERAFTPECRRSAEEIATTARAVATMARNRSAAVKAEVAALAVREDVARLLAEERAREEAARREAEERQREARLRDGIAQAEALAKEKEFDEALRLLGRLRKDSPSRPDLTSSIEKIRRHEWAVKTAQVEEALRQARRVFRRQPKEAVALLEPLDLSGIPEPLARQAYGCWLQACRRLGLEEAVHYAPAFGRGAVLAPTIDDRLEVVSAIGLPRWLAGRRFSPTALKGTRPLN